MWLMAESGKFVIHRSETPNKSTSEWPIILGEGINIRLATKME
jgi:hypothetical protein